jgi:N4-gp56 family major capsid protein
MSTTNFGGLNTNQLTTWSRDLWKAAREHSFIMRFAGKGPNAVIQRITELTKSQKGTRAIISLVADLEGDGVMGDYQLEGNEEAINAYDQEINIDQLRNANRMAGRVADQKTIVNFRNTSKDVLAYWLADRVDQMAFLTATGVAYTEKLNGTTRDVLATGKNLNDLAFASGVTAPTTNRYRSWNGSTLGLVAGATNSDDLATPSYEMLVEAKAYAKDHFIRGCKGPGNMEYYHVFMTPQGIAKLKLDSDFKNAVNNAQVRGGKNPVWTGALPTIDGLVIHEHRHVYNTQGAASGSKWGATGTVDGQAVLFMGAQALALADIGLPYWSEDEFDYDNQLGISVGKMLGLLKPVFRSNVDAGDEDFGILRINTAI